MLACSVTTQRACQGTGNSAQVLQVLGQPCLPELIQPAANSHQHFQKCLARQGRKYTSYLPSLPVQILSSSSFCFLLLATLKAGRKEKEKNKSKEEPQLSHSKPYSYTLQRFILSKNLKELSGISPFNFHRTQVRPLAKLSPDHKVPYARARPAARGGEGDLFKWELNWGRQWVLKMGSRAPIQWGAYSENCWNTCHFN